jgi:hypothetical protein
MPLTPKGTKIMSSMKEQYGSEKGESVFYASKNKGKITGVDSTKVTHSRSIPGLGRTTVTHTNDVEQQITGALPVPERHKDLLGEVSEPETTPRGPMVEAKPPERNKNAGDAGNIVKGDPGPPPLSSMFNPKKLGDAKKKSEDQSSTFLNVQSGAAMNNLGGNIPTPNISATPGAPSSSSTTPPVSTGDSLRAMNVANRQFWSRKR